MKSGRGSWGHVCLDSDPTALLFFPSFPFACPSFKACDNRQSWYSTRHTGHPPTCSLSNGANTRLVFGIKHLWVEGARGLINTALLSVVKESQAEREAQTAAKHANVCAHQRPEREEETNCAREWKTEWVGGWKWLKCPLWGVNKPTGLLVI